MTDDPALEHNLKGHRQKITDLSFNPTKAQVATSSADQNIMLWNLENNVRCYEFKGHSSEVLCVKFSLDGGLMASGSNDGMARIWVPRLKGDSCMFKAHSTGVRSVAFSTDKEKLVTGSHDKSIKMWNVEYHRFLSSYIGHNHWVNCVQYSPDGNILASCSEDKTVRLWDVSSGLCIFTFSTVKGYGTYLSFHKSSNLIAVGMNTGSIRIYDIRNRKIKQHYVLHESTTCVDWHPNANYILSAGTDGTLKIVDVLEGRPLYTLRSHKGSVTSAKFSASGDHFASAGADKLLMVWKANFVNKLHTPPSSCSGVTDGSSKSELALSLNDDIDVM